MTITEALAEIKTINKRVANKRKFVQDYLLRPEMMRDPHDKDGGSALLIESELQAIKDLELRKVNIRQAIAKANSVEMLTIGGDNKSLAQWLIWRREVAPGMQTFVTGLRNQIVRGRQAFIGQEQIEGRKISDGVVKLDLVVNIDEAKLNRSIENLEEILGNLDGALSLKNATVHIEI